VAHWGGGLSRENNTKGIVKLKKKIPFIALSCISKEILTPEND